MSTSHHLLFAILALQNRFIEQEQLVLALNLWAVDKRRPLDELLLQQQMISVDDQQLLRRLVQRQMSSPGGVEKSLSSFSSNANLLEISIALVDPDLQQEWNAAHELPAAATAVFPSSSRQPAGDSQPERQPAGKIRARVDVDQATQDSALVHADSTQDASFHLATNPGTPAAEGSPALTMPESKVGLSGNGTARQALSQAPRFKILHSHAKGGLGEVFVAIDQEIQRQVALKEIQGRYAHDQVARTRFEFEACVTGGLEHPGVVPVYGFGYYPDGRPFYAMRFVRGQSMREAIRDFHRQHGYSKNTAGRQVFRDLLQRFVAACNAIAYAHSRGVLHRDIKPANIMLGKFGETLVVDWGLAKSVGRDEYYKNSEEQTLMPHSGSIGSATMQGSTLGTPSFMSPEQAAGALDQMGPASDIFSLGATLYDLLVGKPPFEGKDAKEIVARVQAMAFEKPRQTNSNIPKLLEAICLKAMAARPQDRYATALELGADIENFLADEPVSASPENQLQKAARWLRRHRTLTASAAVLLLSIAVAAVTGLYFLGQEQAKTMAALAHVQTEQTRTTEALTALSEQQIATTRAWESESAARRQTRETLNLITDDLVGEILGQRSELTETDQLFFDRVLQQFAKFTESSETTSESLNLKADGFLRVANLQRRLGKLAEAEQSYDQAIGLWENLRENEPQKSEYARDLASAIANLGVVFSQRGNDQQAVEKFQDGLHLLEQVAAELDSQDPAIQSRVLLEAGRLEGNIAGSFVRLGRVDAALNHYRQALSRISQLLTPALQVAAQTDRVRILTDFAGLLATQKEGAAEAGLMYEQAVELIRLQATPSQSPTVQLNNAQTLRNYGQFLVASRDPQSGLEHLQHAKQLLLTLSERFPTMAVYRHQLATTYRQLAAAQGLLESQTAQPHFSTAETLLEKLQADFPEQVTYGRDLAQLWEIWGQLPPENAPTHQLDRLRQALDLRRQLWDDNPDSPLLTREVVASQVNLANRFRLEKQYDVAVPLYQELLDKLDANRWPPEIGLRPTLFGLADCLMKLEKFADALELWTRLTSTGSDPNHKHFELQRGIALIQLGQISKGLEVAMETLQTEPTEPVFYYDVACCFALASGLSQKDPAVQAQHAGSAIAYLEKARAAGFFGDERMREHAATDSDLAPLHNHAEFIEFCRVTEIPFQPDK